MFKGVADKIIFFNWRKELLSSSFGDDDNDKYGINILLYEAINAEYVLERI